MCQPTETRCFQGRCEGRLVPGISLLSLLVILLCGLRLVAAEWDGTSFWKPWGVEAGSLQKDCSLRALYVLTHNLVLLFWQGILPRRYFCQDV